MLPGELIPLIVPEVRRLLCRLLWLPRGSPALTIGWSWWRRRHQARAMQCHYREMFLPLVDNEVFLMNHSSTLMIALASSRYRYWYSWIRKFSVAW